MTPRREDPSWLLIGRSCSIRDRTAQQTSNARDQHRDQHTVGYLARLRLKLLVSASAFPSAPVPPLNNTPLPWHDCQYIIGIGYITPTAETKDQRGIMEILHAINPYLTLSGFGVGLLVGLTGVGGGAL